MNQKDSPPLIEAAEEEEKRFLEELESALIEADDPNCVWVPHEVVEEQMRKELAELDALIAAGQEYATHLESQRDVIPTEGHPLHRPT
jgi:hypothetical protein